MEPRFARTLIPALTGVLIFALGASPSSFAGGALAEPVTAGGLAYPETRKVDQVDTYHGVEVADPYRWLEDDTEEVRRWVQAQGALLESYVEPVAGFEALEKRIYEIGRYDRIGLPVRQGELYFFSRTEAGEKHGTLYVQKVLSGEPRPVLDFGHVLGDPDHSMGGFAPSPDGRHVVWASQSQGAWGWLDVARVEDGRLLPERIQGIAGNSAIWTHDSRGFFYVTYGDDLEALKSGAAKARPRLLYHRLGTDPATDELVYQREDRPAMLFSPKLTDDGRYLVVGLNDGDRTRNSVVFRDLEPEPGAGEVSEDGTRESRWGSPEEAKAGASFQQLISEADAGYVFEGNLGKRFFFRTTLGAPRGRVIAVDLDRPQRRHWQEIIPEREAPLSTVSHVAGRLVTVSTVHAKPAVEVWTQDGRKERQLELPAIGLFSGLADDLRGRHAFYRMNSLHDPGTVYRVDLATGKSVVHHRPRLVHDPDDYEIRQVFYPAADGTKIPMFLAHRKDVPLKSQRPLFMYGYGHGGWVAFPWFQPHLVAWMDLGGTYALPGLRGGGEYGAEWQAAGTLLEKPTTVSDFIAAAEWLVEEGYTTPARLVANGGSASSVLPAAAVVQRPDLFAAAVIDFPFLDMLRYDRFTRIQGWTRGYGSASDPEEFRVLHSYSPLHSLKQGAAYPATLTIVGEEDTSTVPMHGYKFTAALQAAQGCTKPILLKLVPKAGHYVYGVTPEASAETQAEIIAFLLRSLEIGGGASEEGEARKAAPAAG